MDIHMPGMDGFETMQQIKTIDRSIPVIALSADAFSDQQSNALNSGFDGYLTKPIQTDQLILCLKEFLLSDATDEPRKVLSEEERTQLAAILKKLSDFEIFETEKLVEVMEETSGLLPVSLKEEMLNLIYAGDEVGMTEKIKHILADD